MSWVSIQIFLVTISFITSAWQFDSKSFKSIEKSSSQQARLHNQKASPLSITAQLSQPAYLTGQFCKCGKVHWSRKSAFKNGRTTDRISNDFPGFGGNAEINLAKRNVKREEHEVKCLQKDIDTVTCFSGGKFYQFQGHLQAIIDDYAATPNCPYVAAIQKGKRFCKAFSGKSQIFEGDILHSKENFLKKHLSSVNRVIPDHSRTARYQKVMMEPSSRKGPTKRCSRMGRSLKHTTLKKMNSTHLSAKQSSIFNPSSMIHSGFPFSKILNSRKMSSSNQNLNESNDSNNQRSAFITHLLGKRSQMVSVGCRPMYIPTAKPSVNEGRVPHCRIPCGAHNCGPVPTCPCSPSCHTPAPPLTTCSPIPGLDESQTTLPTRCPTYELTDEPCPSFECKDGCPYMTSPGCGSARSTGGLQGERHPINKVNPENQRGTSTLNSVAPGPTTKSLVDPESIRTTESRTSTVHQTERASISTTSLTVEENPPRDCFSIAPGSNNVTGNNKIVPLLKNTGPQDHDSSFGSRKPGVWSCFDIKKLLKSARSHYKEKVELNVRKDCNEA